MAEMGRPVIFQDDIQCVSLPQEYFGCLPDMNCGQALTYFCKGNEIYLSSDTCPAPGWGACMKDYDFPDCK
jgi:hypothetical protein